MSDEPELQRELQTLSQRLEIRHSIASFAWAFGFGCAAFMGIGVALKLFHDSVRVPTLAYLLMALGLGFAVASVWRLVRGRALHGAELRDFERFKSVCHLLGLDRPQLPSA